MNANYESNIITERIREAVAVSSSPPPPTSSSSLPGAAHTEANKRNILFISNLTFEFNEHYLREQLHSLFSRFGNGLVEFVHGNEAEDALQVLSGTKFLDRILFIKWSFKNNVSSNQSSCNDHYMDRTQTADLFNNGDIDYRTQSNEKNSYEDLNSNNFNTSNLTDELTNSNSPCTRKTRHTSAKKLKSQVIIPSNQYRQEEPTNNHYFRKAYNAQSFSNKNNNSGNNSSMSSSLEARSHSYELRGNRYTNYNYSNNRKSNNHEHLRSTDTDIEKDNFQSIENQLVSNNSSIVNPNVACLISTLINKIDTIGNQVNSLASTSSTTSISSIRELQQTPPLLYAARNEKERHDDMNRSNRFQYNSGNQRSRSTTTNNSKSRYENKRNGRPNNYQNRSSYSKSKNDDVQIVDLSNDSNEANSMELRIENQIQNCRAISEEDTIKMIKERFKTNASLQIIDPFFTISLICPHGFKRIEIPARGINCSHVQCFDLRSYLHVNYFPQTKKNLRWKCPVCKLYIPVDELRIDTFTKNYLKQILNDESINEMSVDANVNFKKEKTQQVTNVVECEDVENICLDEIVSNRISPPEEIIIDDLDEELTINDDCENENENETLDADNESDSDSIIFVEDFSNEDRIASTENIFKDITNADKMNELQDQNENFEHKENKINEGKEEQDASKHDIGSESDEKVVDMNCSQNKEDTILNEPVISNDCQQEKRFNEDILVTSQEDNNVEENNEKLDKGNEEKDLKPNDNDECKEEIIESNYILFKEFKIEAEQNIGNTCCDKDNESDNDSIIIEKVIEAQPIKLSHSFSKPQKLIINFKKVLPISCNATTEPLRLINEKLTNNLTKNSNKRARSYQESFVNNLDCNVEHKFDEFDENKSSKIYKHSISNSETVEEDNQKSALTQSSITQNKIGVKPKIKVVFKNLLK